MSDIQDLISLGLNVYYEARGEPLQGQQAVALVTLNRTRESRWPDTVHEVVWQDTKPNVVGGEQYSWTIQHTNVDAAVNAVRNPVKFRECMCVAADVLAGKVEDFTGGANHYYADTIPMPQWARNMTTTLIIGHHRFLRG